MASGFVTIAGRDGSIKYRANFGRSKEMSINMYNGHVYMHISDKSNAWVNGEFDVTKCKSVTLGSDEVVMLCTLMGHFDYFQNILQSPPHVQPHDIQEQASVMKQEPYGIKEDLTQPLTSMQDPFLAGLPIPTVTSDTPIHNMQTMEFCDDALFVEGVAWSTETTETKEGE